MKLVKCRACNCGLKIIPISRQSVSFKNKALCFECWLNYSNEDVLKNKSSKKKSSEAKPKSKAKNESPRRRRASK